MKIKFAVKQKPKSLMAALLLNVGYLLIEWGSMFRVVAQFIQVAY
jgi:hypothetical protein